jgi:predicted PurR-regulated permease PerM
VPRAGRPLGDSLTLERMTSDPSARRFFFLLLGGATVLLVLVMRPLATALFLATVLAVVLWPVYRRLAARLGDRPRVSASVVVLGVVLLLVAPVAGLSAFLVKEGSEGLKFVATMVRSEGMSGLVRKLPGPLEKWAAEGLARVPEQWEPRGKNRGAAEEASAAGAKTAAAVGVAARATGSLVSTSCSDCRSTATWARTLRQTCRCPRRPPVRGSCALCRAGRHRRCARRSERCRP